MIQKPRGIDLVLCQCNLCLFTNLEAMTKCNVIVTSTVTETVRLQAPERSGRDENVAPLLCQCDPLPPDYLVCLVSGKVKRRAKCHRENFYLLLSSTQWHTTLYNIFHPIQWFILLPLSFIYLMALISSL